MQCLEGAQAAKYHRMLVRAYIEAGGCDPESFIKKKNYYSATPIILQGYFQRPL